MQRVAVGLCLLPLFTTKDKRPGREAGLLSLRLSTDNKSQDLDIYAKE